MQLDFRDGRLLRGALFFFFASWPFPLLVNRIGLYSLVLVAAITFFTTRRERRPNGPPLVSILLLVFFLTYVLADLLAGVGLSEGVIGRYFLFIVIPLLMVSVAPFMTPETQNSALKGFVAGNVI